MPATLPQSWPPMASEFQHLPVLLEPVLHALELCPGCTSLDGTLGGGGHALAVAQHLGPTGHLVGIDRDPQALASAGKVLDAAPCPVTLLRGNFHRAKELLEEAGIATIDRALLDLGVSSPQLDQPERGFSYHRDGPLDMRMSPDDPTTAASLIATIDQARLTRILREWGEERYAHRIAGRIIRERELAPITSTLQLADIVRAAMPPTKHREEQHPARRTFQALRIAVNGELDGLEQALREIVDLLAPGGRLAVITFHSLEDRIVKRTFASLANPCTCPRQAPICRCGHLPVIAKPAKSVTADADELARNPRARSARLRTAVKL